MREDEASRITAKRQKLLIRVITNEYSRRRREQRLNGRTFFFWLPDAVVSCEAEDTRMTGSDKLDCVCARFVRVRDSLLFERRCSNARARRTHLTPGSGRWSAPRMGTMKLWIP